MVDFPPVSTIHWEPSWRLVPSRFPPVGLFDRVANAADLEAVFAIESLTNARLRNEVGDIRLVPEGERQTGPGTTPIMASFTHIGNEGRFHDSNFGVYYAAKDIDTGLAETRYHRERFLQQTNEPPIDIDMRSYASEINSELHDIRGMKENLTAVYSENSYSESQNLARVLRDDGSNGIVYDSVRHPDGECVGIFRANIPQPVVQGSHYCFQWDGNSIYNTYRKEAL
jgi:hypothetical protein